MEKPQPASVLDHVLCLQAHVRESNWLDHLEGSEECMVFRDVLRQHASMELMIWTADYRVSQQGNNDIHLLRCFGFSIPVDGDTVFLGLSGEASPGEVEATLRAEGFGLQLMEFLHPWGPDGGLQQRRHRARHALDWKALVDEGVGLLQARALEHATPQPTACAPMPRL